jgi:hypothetical protein
MTKNISLIFISASIIGCFYVPLEVFVLLGHGDSFRWDSVLLFFNNLGLDVLLKLFFLTVELTL